MRMVVLTSSFPRNADDPSGHFVRSSARALTGQGHEVHVVAPGGALFTPPEHDGGLWVHRAGGGALFAWPGALERAREAPWRLTALPAFAAGALVRLRRIGAVDRVVAHWIVPCALPIALAATSAPLFVVAHGADVRLLLRAPRPARERALMALLARGARFTFAAGALLTALERSVSPALSTTLHERARVEPPAIDVPDVAEQAAALRRSLALAAGEHLAVTVARLVASKRVGLAVAAARAAGTRLVVVGDGPERAPLEREAGARVTFTGGLPRREALAWIAAADVLVHPSEVEAAPTVIREARALGVAVVACEAGDVRTWSLSDPGIHVVNATVEALREALSCVAGRRACNCLRFG